MDPEGPEGNTRFGFEAQERNISVKTPNTEPGCMDIPILYNEISLLDWWFDSNMVRLVQRLNWVVVRLRPSLSESIEG